MTLAEIIKQARSNIGNNLDYIGTQFHLPELKVSEAFAAEPTMNTNNPGITVDQMNRNTQGILGSAAYQSALNKGSVNGVTSPTIDKTGNGGGGNGGGTPTGGGNNGGGKSQEQIAQERYNAAKNAVLSRLQMMKDEAGRLRGEAQKGFDFTTGEVGKNYESLKTLSKEKLQQALDTLTAQDVSTQNMYGRVAGNARRAMESAIGRNRGMYRALGSLGSSFYTNAQGDTTNQGMNAVNDTAVEEAAKRGAIGTQKSATTTDFTQNDVAIGAEETKLKQAALDKYNTDVANANLLEKNYNIDSEQAISEANSNLDSALNQIREYALTSKPIATTDKTYNTLSASLPNFNAIDPIKSTLDNTQNYDNANKFIAKADTAGTPASLGGSAFGLGGGSDTGLADNSYLTYIKNKAKKSTVDPNQYYVNSPYSA